jgi:hypothetical protein
MAPRLAGQAIGLYPALDRVLDVLGIWLQVPSGVVALHPSGGTGAALAALAPEGFTYGVELDDHRAHAAQP